MFVHVYEETLQSRCQYDGAHPYWNWVLDSSDLSHSPVFHTVSGFGGNDRSWKHFPEKDTVINEPHCLSRWFRDRASLKNAEDEALYEKIHDRISPEYVEQTLAATDYNSFFKKFEAGAHNAIPMFIRGEWLNFTATNDPLFFLHHTQVDRLWWLWQNQDLENRTKEYFGSAENFLEHPHNMGSHPTDVLQMGGLTSNGKVVDYLDTRAGHLCYTYDG
ncbi:hypothetical protein EsH8_VII_000915 [Colletotrichum jinshuiense]